MFLGQSKQQRLLWREVGYRQPLGLLQPAVAIRLTAVVTFDLEMIAEHFELALNSSHLSGDTRLLELIVKLAGGDLPDTRNAEQQFDCKQNGFERVRAFSHVSSSALCR